MAFMQRAVLHAIPSQITTTTTEVEVMAAEAIQWTYFFLLNTNYSIALLYENIMITSFQEWRDVSFLYGRLVCNVFGNINTYFVSNDFIIAIIFLLYMHSKSLTNVPFVFIHIPF